MGWQSYYIIFKTDDERQAILQAIRSHNTETNFDIVGEEIIGVMERRVRDTDKFVMLFGNGGGRSSTFEYFSNRRFHIQPYSKVLDNSLVATESYVVEHNTK